MKAVVDSNHAVVLLSRDICKGDGELTNVDACMRKWGLDRDPALHGDKRTNAVALHLLEPFEGVSHVLVDGKTIQNDLVIIRSLPPRYPAIFGMPMGHHSRAR